MVHVMDYSAVPKRDILCIDNRSFFASVECVKRGLDPLTTFLVVMSHSDRPGGLVLAATPKMKEVFKIKTGSRRFELPDDPRILIVPPRMNLYLKVNHMIQQIFLRYVPSAFLRPFSIDECFFDVTGSHALFGTTEEIAKRIQSDILNELRLHVTIGMGDNLLLAKLALDNAAKKNHEGLAEWRYDNIKETVWQIPNLTDFVGIGERMARRLYGLNIYSIFELSQASSSLLKHKLGVIGTELFYHAHGLDFSRIDEKYVPSEKSFGKSQILERDYDKPEEVAIVIREMTEEIAMRLRESFLDTSTVYLSIGYSKYSALKGFRKQVKIQPTNASQVLVNNVLTIFWEQVAEEPIRSVSISCGTLTPKKGLQLNLFEPAEKSLQQQQLDRTIDKIRKRYGFQAMMHASSLAEGATGLKRSSFVGGHQG
jgi:DNA polymerase V